MIIITAHIIDTDVYIGKYKIRGKKMWKMLVCLKHWLVSYNIG